MRRPPWSSLGRSLNRHQLNEAPSSRWNEARESVFKIKPRVSRKTAHGTPSDTHRGGLSRVRFTFAGNRVSLLPFAVVCVRACVCVSVYFFFPPLCRLHRDRDVQHGPRAVALVASLRPDLRTVADYACRRSGSATHARWSRWRPGSHERWRGCRSGNSKGKSRGGTYTRTRVAKLSPSRNFAFVFRECESLLRRSIDPNDVVDPSWMINWRIRLIVWIVINQVLPPGTDNIQLCSRRGDKKYLNSTP